MHIPQTPNPYEPPLAPVADADGDPASEPFSQSEFVAFAGKQAYGARLHALHARTTTFPGFNPWALLFGASWFAFRKLYALSAVALGIEFGLPAFVGTVLAAGGMSPDARVTTYFVVFAALRLLYGLFGNIAVLWRAEAVIAQVDAMNLDNDAHLKQLAARGGVSVAGLLIVWFGSALLQLALFGA